MSDQTKQALCCVCGALRTCRRPRNYRPENYWLREPIDRDWQREVGDLKCAECKRVTPHAIIFPESDTWRNHAEQLHRMAIGWEFKTMTPETHQRVRSRWRDGFPANPLLRHQWWISDETAARKAGETHVITICMTYTRLPKKVTKPGTGVDRDQLMEPKQYGLEEGYEDPATGLTWTAMSCPDCFRRSNAIALEDQRKKLRDKLLEITANFSTLDAGTVERLLGQFSDSCEGGEQE